jgi:hypothetical protein
VIDEHAIEIDEAYLRYVVERLESFRSHPLGFRVAGTPEEREATAFIAFAIERGRRGRDAPRACWGAQGDPDTGADLWSELASLRRETGAREPGAWLEESLEAKIATSRVELERRLQRMSSAARGEVFPLPKPRPEDLPQGRKPP